MHYGLICRQIQQIKSAIMCKLCFNDLKSTKALILGRNDLQKMMCSNHLSCETLRNLFDSRARTKERYYLLIETNAFTLCAFDERCMK